MFVTRQELPPINHGNVRGVRPICMDWRWWHRKSDPQYAAATYPMPIQPLTPGMA